MTPKTGRSIRGTTRERIRFVSFDLDGTLVDQCFVDSVWFEGIPRLYAEKEDLSFESARELVKKEYDEVGMERLEWYDVKYWFKRLDLGGSWKSLINSFRFQVKLYPEVLDVLEKLKQRGSELGIITNAPREFLEVELDETGIRSYFSHVFSSTSDFRKVKKTTRFYLEILEALEIQPWEMIHVGDNWNFDYLIPSETGIMSFYLDRPGRRTGEHVVWNLKDFAKKIERYL